MAERQKKKILILTLGVGRPRTNENLPGYQFTAYQFENDTTVTNTAYVAEPLIHSFCPDIIFIIGTVKSAWFDFYNYFAIRENEESELILLQLEEKNTKNTAGEELKKATEAINEIYKKDLKKAPFSSEIETHVILTRYGMNQNELLENYQLISSISAYMDKNTDYEIAFDITHSFRSLPIYNLVILNYLNTISNMKVEITHIYYGNFEIKRENNNIAPIIDLHALINVLNLTSGVNEFKNTGNCVTLLSLIPENETELRDALEKFDWATQVNSFDQVQKALLNLLKLTEKESPNSNQYADLNRMVYAVLCRKFLNIDGTMENAVNKLEKMSLAEKRLMISTWYLNQNRYGQAVVTAYEALKSYLVPIYLKEVRKRTDITEEDYLKENNLRETVQQLKSVYRYCLKKKGITSLSEFEKFFVELEEIRKQAALIRNRFAHNLTEEGDSKHTRENLDQEKRCIRRLIELIKELEEKIKEHYFEVAEVFSRKNRN